MLTDHLGVLASLLAIIVSILGASFAMVWRFASLATELKTSIEEVTKDLTKVETALTALNAIPTHAVRIGQLEGVTGAITPRISDFEARLRVLESNPQRRGSQLDPAEVGGE